jgi:predicted phosphodiesterase
MHNIPAGKPPDRFAAKGWSNGQVVMSIIAAALLILAGVAGSVGAMYFYTINEKAPTVAITNLSSAQPVAGPIEIRGSATGETQAIFVKVDGGSAVSATPKAPDDFSSWSAVVEVTTPGSHTIEVQVVDSEGKVHSNTQSLKVTEPAPTMEPPPDRLIEATGAAGAEVHYPLPVVTGNKADLVGPTCSPSSGELFPIGNTTVNCVATHGGTELAASFTVFVNDSTPPAIHAPPNVISNASGEVLTRVSLGFPVVSDIVDANPSVSNDAPSTGFPPGTTSIVWTATDDHGNFAIAVQTVTVLAGTGNATSSDTDDSNTSVTYYSGGGGGGGGGGSSKSKGKDKPSDTTAPVVTAFPLGGSYSSPQSVVLSANEQATIYFTTDGTIPTTSSTVYTSAIGVSSNKTLMYFAKDKSGNEGSVVTQVYIIEPDKTKPSVAILQPAADSDVTVTDGEILVTGTASDSGTGINLVEVRLDKSQFMAATPKSEGDWSSWQATFSIADGEHQLVSRATDNAGNQAWNNIDFTVDTPSPPPVPGPDFNFGAAGDWGDSDDAGETASNMADHGVELALLLGDFSYRSDLSDINKWWNEDMAPLHGISVAALGNHDDHSSAMKNRYHSLFDLADEDPDKDWLFSFNYLNVHFLAMNTEAGDSKGSEQYKFVQEDLAAAASNTDVTWIVVFMHVPMYTSPSEHEPEADIQRDFHPLFDQYGVDLVLYGHNHNYQRSYPLKHNASNPASPIIETTEKADYKDPQGQVYVLAGMGGKSHYALEEQAPFVVKQDDNHFGFINIDIINDGKTMKGTFYTNGGSALDAFTIDKS